jgi:hypothetical protein
VKTYALKRTFVQAERFFRDKPRPAGVEPQDCYCADVAQDGRHCELHKEHGRRYGRVRVGDISNERVVEIQYGDWIVSRPGEYRWPVYSVLTDKEFNARYELAEQEGQAA